MSYVFIESKPFYMLDMEQCIAHLCNLRLTDCIEYPESQRVDSLVLTICIIKIKYIQKIFQIIKKILGAIKQDLCYSGMECEDYQYLITNNYDVWSGASVEMASAVCNNNIHIVWAPDISHNNNW